MLLVILLENIVLYYAQILFRLKILWFLLEKEQEQWKKFIGNIKGVQVAILNLTLDDIEEIISNLQEKGIIQISGYNSKTQIVLSLEENLLEDLKNLVSEKRVD